MAPSNFPDYKHITLADMKSYIEENAPQDKAWFKSVAFNAKGKYQHLSAVSEFCKRYMPEIIPKAKPKEPNKSKFLEDW